MGYLGFTCGEAVTGSTPQAEASVKGQLDILGFAVASWVSRVFPGPGTPELSHQLPLPSSDPGESPSLPSPFPPPPRHLSSGPVAQQMGGEREATEGGAHGGHVGAHGGEDQPVAHVQLGQLHPLQQELVKGIAPGAVEGAREEGQLGAEVLQGHGGRGVGIREGRHPPFTPQPAGHAPRAPEGRYQQRLCHSPTLTNS